MALCAFPKKFSYLTTTEKGEKGKPSLHFLWIKILQQEVLIILSFKFLVHISISTGPDFIDLGPWLGHTVNMVCPSGYTPWSKSKPHLGKILSIKTFGHFFCLCGLFPQPAASYVLVAIQWRFWNPIKETWWYFFGYGSRQFNSVDTNSVHYCILVCPIRSTVWMQTMHSTVFWMGAVSFCSYHLRHVHFFLIGHCPFHVFSIDWKLFWSCSDSLELSRLGIIESDESS